MRRQGRRDRTRHTTGRRLTPTGPNLTPTSTPTRLIRSGAQRHSVRSGWGDDGGIRPPRPAVYKARPTRRRAAEFGQPTVEIKVIGFTADRPQRSGRCLRSQRWGRGLTFAVSRTTHPATGRPPGATTQRALGPRRGSAPPPPAAATAGEEQLAGIGRIHLGVRNTLRSQSFTHLGSNRARC